MHEPRDGDASLLGRLGLRNELACWLLAKGHGAFLGMTPSEIEAYQRTPAPRCPHEDDGERCRRPMVAHGTEWVCYHHEPPERRRDEPLRPLYADGRIEDHLGDVVDMEYSREPWERAATWKARVRKF